METYVVEQKGITICAEVSKTGEEYLVNVYGGEKPHIGSVVLAEPRDSLTGEGRSATSSVLNRIGHKDEYIARMFAEKIATEKNAATVCVAGVHMDQITKEQMQAVEDLVKELLGKVLER